MKYKCVDTSDVMGFECEYLDNDVRKFVFSNGTLVDGSFLVDITDVLYFFQLHMFELTCRLFKYRDRYYAAYDI